MTSYGGYSRTNYNATGGDDSGGFFGGSQISGSQGGTKHPSEESLRPVTVKQIIDAEQAFGSDGTFRIDGVDVSQVTFVGMVRQISPQTTNITYRLDDGTGVVEVKQWLDPDKQETDAGAKGSAFREEQYVRVWGRLKSFGNKRHVGAHVIKPVTDFNEVNYHLLEATYVHLFFTKGGGMAGAGGMGAGGDGNAAEDDSMFVENNDAAFLRGATPRAKKMYQYLNQSKSNEGVNIHIIARDTGMTVQDAMTAAEELLGNGKVYTTLDDETFALLEGF
ncbi:replication protein A, subunit RPA32 [Annulohypoxylon maeteangense]|uniref:replication protein A, subunit RPA32 n=1 Tax=Annulohypoxylon maeteangense TaxID=1927788 RepID=UPI002007359B|nr:replication protein A, subunit RPA32 [Annulohypoxylon maeteangense]KAI0888989.1 replication protein A, subunit RPA32 [Annulohypoxylon maeteangense]